MPFCSRAILKAPGIAPGVKRVILQPLLLQIMHHLQRCLYPLSSGTETSGASVSLIFAVAYSLLRGNHLHGGLRQNSAGHSIEKASLLATIHGFAQVIGVLTLLPLSDYLGRKKTIIIMTGFIAASLFGIVLSGHSWGMLCFLVGLFAVFYGPTFPIYGACAGDYFPKAVMGNGPIGAWTPFYGIGPSCPTG